MRKKIRAFMHAALIAALALPALAQSPAPAAPAASTPTVTASTSSVIKAGDGLHIGGEAGAPKPPKLSRPIKAHIPKEGKDWEPLGLQEGGDPYQASTSVTLKLVKGAKGLKGERSKAKAKAVAYQAKPGETLFVVAVFPQALEKRRKHFELRFRVVEGNVESVEAALMSITDKHAYKEVDRVVLRKAGASFEEEFPGSGVVSVAAFDPRPGKAFNAGKLSKAEFADPDAGFVDLGWSLKSVEKP